MGAMQWQHWVLILVIVLLLFGTARLPGLAKSVGQSMKIFKKEINELRDDKADGKTDADDGKVADRTADAPTGSSTGSTTSSGTGSPADKGGDAPKA
ncbi:sec-independent protein translocase protein TatA [Promicromonospora sp. AC04]|uniref:twin-arginine translocase TatA/TatE family subunit n=1 Tax=Promicromonospora sp. AC04 TaxID=2135723 RepID=UPI000D3D5517|nr:twin-arginine translocase TatA/TatE family subunit [Promicromonospora sp. AC04]PUB26198.1 sec-independent protein translocase protein TatA [Promicromonospora sp. AC04]